MFFNFTNKSCEIVSCPDTGVAVGITLMFLQFVFTSFWILQCSISIVLTLIQHVVSYRFLSGCNLTWKNFLCSEEGTPKCTYIKLLLSPEKFWKIICDIASETWITLI